MAVWESEEMSAAENPVERDFAAIWQTADKIVYSRTLDHVSTTRTRLERSFDPDAVARIKAAATRDLTVSGPELAGQALAAGLVDERRFGNGTVFLRYFLGSERA
jgi:hypothetical protein